MTRSLRDQIPRAFVSTLTTTDMPGLMLGQRLVRVDLDAHGHALGDLGEVARGVVGPQDAELGTGRRREPLDMPVSGPPREAHRPCTVTGWPSRMPAIWVSLKLAMIHIRSGTMAMSCVPAVTYCPSRTPTSPSSPSCGATMRVFCRSISASCTAASAPCTAASRDCRLTITVAADPAARPPGPPWPARGSPGPARARHGPDRPGSAS